MTRSKRLNGVAFGGGLDFSLLMILNSVAFGAGDACILWAFRMLVRQGPSSSLSAYDLYPQTDPFCSSRFRPVFATLHV